MANTNKPFGFSPWRTRQGASWNGGGNVYYIPTTDGSVFTVGDPVISAAIMDANGVPGVAIATGTSTVRGVIVGVLPVHSAPSLVGASLALETMVIPATKAHDYYVMVCDDPDVIYKCQMDNGTVTSSAALNTTANKNCSFTVNSGTGTLSNAVLGAATINTTNTLNVKLMGLVNDATSNTGVSMTGTTGQYAVYQCIFNEHEFNGATAGI